ncbi:helix-turn-helix domain-containing protein [Micromonospora sp. NBC_00389]|uniref:helix-turn-helix domain-containing protein n=1 Tax=Micromonospora sp. NBC_00389 TaxID=2903586 RepID=UPI003FA53EB5
MQAYRFALDPSDVQVLGLRRNTGAARFAYNHMLRRVSAVKAQRAAEASYGVAEAEAGSMGARARRRDGASVACRGTSVWRAAPAGRRSVPATPAPHP